ncbi:MAG: hypothetical protein GEU88_13700 [Solirubrobacterales bacterium]|nr:hypothetical protein [Solirubrobacterales bacterium]
MQGRMRGLGARAMRIGLCSAGLALLGGVVAIAPAQAKGPGTEVKITRNAQGIPTIEADDYRGLGYGYAYAFAEDNLCTLADTYVTVSAQRSRYFGPGAESPDGFSNLDSDFFFQRIKDRGIVEELVAEKPPTGPKRKIGEVVKGYVAGYNRWLKRTGVDNITDPACSGAEWVRPITRMDAYRRFYQLTEFASGGIAMDGIAQAQPPGAAAPRGGASARRDSGAGGEEPAGTAGVTRDRVEKLGAALDLGGLGSNGWGLGREATENRSGMVLANPHFPWGGSERFYQSHLVIPGKVDVSGASLFGSPVILIGHTQNLAWTHTVSTAFRFVPMELKLVPGDPTSYLVDGQPAKMEANQVTVQARQPDGSLAPVTRTLYTSRYGPIINSLQGQELFAWTPTTAYTMFDSNAHNLGRLMNHFFETNTAQSTKELLAILRKYQGIPWVNTMAADSKGRALYADIGTMPNVPNSKATGCAGALGALTFETLGLPLLDGSRSECAPGTDPDSAAPGIFGPSQQPYMSRRDYVANSNDSYWLTNPEFPLEGYARIIGDERTERSLRTRLGLIMIEQRLAGEDGYQGDRFTRNQLRRIEFNDRLYGGELFSSQIASFCAAHPTLVGSAGPVNVSGACPVLANYDDHVDLDSAGAILFRRFMSNLGSPPFTTPFDVVDPVHTPAGLDTSDPEVGAALADAVTDLQGAGIPLDARLGDYQYVVRDGDRIPIHGGPGPQGAFNVITADWDPPAGYPEVTHGSSFVMVTSFGKNGEGCPRDRSILTYSQSTNPNSKYFDDQTKMYSQKKWVDPPFCAGQVKRTAKHVEVLRAK